VSESAKTDFLRLRPTLESIKMFVKFQDQIYLIKDVLPIQTLNTSRSSRHHKRKRVALEAIQKEPLASESSDEECNEVMIGVNVSIDPHKRQLVCIRSSDTSKAEVNLDDNTELDYHVLYKALELLTLQCVADLPFMYERRERWVWHFRYGGKRRKVCQVAKIFSDGFLALDADDEIRHYKFNKISYDEGDGMKLYQEWE